MMVLLLACWIRSEGEDSEGEVGETAVEEPVDADGDGHDETIDCDDQDPSVHPGADELCDGQDQDCDGDVDEDAVDAVLTHLDEDGDGYGAVAEVLRCEAVTEDASDCDDADPLVNPDADEVCNGVDDDCDGTADFGFSVPGTHATLQQATEAAPDGATICVGAGTWEGVVLQDRELRIEGVEGSVLSGGGPVVQVVGGEVSLARLTVAGGVADAGAGLSVSGGATVTLEQVEVRENSCAATSCTGTGVLVDDAVLLAWDSAITDNVQSGEACRGAGLLARGSGPYVGLESVTLSGNEQSCDAELTGTGMALESGTHELIDVLVDENRQLPRLDQAVARGAGAWIAADSLTISGLTTSGNSVEAGPGVDGVDASGVGLFLDPTTSTLAEITSTDNVATAKSTLAVQGVGLWVGTATIDGLVLSGNAADAPTLTSTGGGAWVGAYLVADGAELVANQATQGGAIYAAGGFTLTHALVAGNQAAGHVLWASGTPTVRCAVIAENAANVLAGLYPSLVQADLVDNEGTAIESTWYPYTLTHVNLVNQPSAVSQSCACQNAVSWVNSWGSPSLGCGTCLATNPLYVDVSTADPVDWDLHLQAGSGAMDVGPGVDAKDGSAQDLGAYGGDCGDW